MTTTSTTSSLTTTAAVTCLCLMATSLAPTTLAATLDKRLTNVALMQNVLEALDRGVRFFAEDFSAINVDGLFGIRTAEGSVVSILNECQAGKVNCPEDLVRKLEEFHQTITRVGRKAMPYVKAQDPAYFERFQEMVDAPYVLDYRPELLHKGRRVAPTGITYDEERGDACLELVLGTGALFDKPQPTCTITKECLDFMMTPDLDKYSITHQLIYFIFIGKKGCEKELERMLPDEDSDSLRVTERRFCRNILGEARSEVVNGKVNEFQQDLFLEQTLLCGMLGFEDFFEESYIHMVLSWQRPMGCFSMNPALITESLVLERLKAEQRKLVEALKEEATAIEHAPPATGRKLLREVQMEGNCLAHKTGLGVGTLGVYLRYLVEQVYKD